MSYNHGVFQGAPPGASGLPQMPQGQQVLPPQQAGGVSYSPDHLPPPPSAQTYGGQQPPATAPYGVQPGVPGGQIVQPYQPAMPQPHGGYVQPQGGTPAPQQTFGYPPNGGQQPSAQPQSQPGRAELNDNTILDGPNVPPELRGRTWGEARRLYSALSVDWLQRHQQPQTPAQQSLQQQRQAQQPYGFQQQPQTHSPFAQQRQGQGQFWQDPEGRVAEIVSQVIDQRVAPMLQPVVQQTQAAGIVQARNIAATGIADFQYLEPDIMQIVAGSNPQDLQNPQIWIAAARMARGQRMEAGQYNPQAAQQSQVPQARQPYGPGASVPAQPVHSFFSESPSAPNLPASYGGYGAPKAPTQEDHFYAQKWQMPIQDFMAWKYGAGQPGAGGSF